MASGKFLALTMIDTSNSTYLVPLFAHSPVDAEFTDYLRLISKYMQVVVIDSSPEPIFREHAERWKGLVTHLAVDSDLVTPNGKVGAVLTGVRYSQGERLVIADDDVRYDATNLAQILSLLGNYPVVRPQNYFSPLPWHAAWDSSRSLVARLFGGDWPGTLGVRKSAIMAAEGYSGDVLFENLQLIRALQSAGYVEHVAFDLFVRRSPCSFEHFRSQRVRQAYDEWARPRRLITQLSLMPMFLMMLRRWPMRTIVSWTVISFSLAEAGRRRARGTTAFPVRCALWAPLWVLERAICAWIAVGARLRGGVRYGDGRIARAARPTNVANRRE